MAGHDSQTMLIDRSQKAKITHIGEWLSLVEHSVRDAGVGGSNPLFPTIFQGVKNFLNPFFASICTAKVPPMFHQEAASCFLLLQNVIHNIFVLTYVPFSQ